MWCFPCKISSICGHLLIGIFLLNINVCSIASAAESRQFNVQINPDCNNTYQNPEDCSKDTLSLIHIRSEGPHDTLHFIWSFIGAPSLLLARTEHNTNLRVDWPLLFQGPGKAIKFDPAPSYLFGWSLVKVWMFNDRNDTGRLDQVDQSDVEGYDAKNFAWVRLDNQSTTNSSFIDLTIEARDYDHREGEGLGSKQMGPDGFFRFTIRMKNTEDYSTVLPYMMYNENNTQLDIAFNDVQLNTTVAEYPDFPRVAFNYILVQYNGNKNESSERMKLEVTKTLDDEHSPGVFEVYNIKTPAKGIDQSYLQWKPICYTSSVRDVSDSVDVIAYPLKQVSSILLEDNIQDTILWSYFGDEIANFTLEKVNISFGTQGDGFYNKTKHISWTYTTGFGVPPPDRVSMLVVLVVSIGLGTPALIIVLSVIYMACREKRTRDDLLLRQ